MELCSILMTDRGSPKHEEFHSKIKFEKVIATSWIYYKKFITMHGHMNVKNLVWYSSKSGAQWYEGYAVIFSRQA